MKKMLFTLVAAAGAALLFVSCGQKKMTPDEQFKAVLRNGVMSSTNKFANGFHENFNQINKSSFGADGTFSIELDEKNAPLIRGIFTAAVPDLNLDWFNSIQISSNSTLKDEDIAVTLGLGVNSVNIVSLECIEDLGQSKVYISIPELLKQYFKIDAKENYSLQETFALYLAELKLLKTAPSEKVFTGFVEEILDATLADISGVERGEQSLQAGLSSSKTVSADFTTLSFALSEEWCETTAKNVKKAVLSSENLKTILDWILPIGRGILYEDISTKEVVKALADSFEEAYEDLGYEQLTLTLYADSKSNLKGLKIGDRKDVVESKFVQNGSSFGYTFSAKEGKNELVALNGFGSYSGGKMTGDFKVFADDEDIFSFSTKNLDLEGLQALKANGTVSFKLTEELQRELRRELRYTLDKNTLSLIDGLTITLNMAQKDRKSGSAELVLGTSEKDSYFKIKAEGKYSSGSRVSIPKDAVDVMELDDDEALEYVKAIDLSTVVRNLKKAKVEKEYVDAISEFNGEALANIIESYTNPYGSSRYNNRADNYDWWN